MDIIESLKQLPESPIIKKFENIISVLSESEYTAYFRIVAQIIAVTILAIYLRRNKEESEKSKIEVDIPIDSKTKKTQ